ESSLKARRSRTKWTMVTQPCDLHALKLEDRIKLRLRPGVFNRRQDGNKQMVVTPADCQTSGSICGGGGLEVPDRRVPFGEAAARRNCIRCGSGSEDAHSPIAL